MMCSLAESLLLKGYKMTSYGLKMASHKGFLKFFHEIGFLNTDFKKESKTI